MVIDVRLFEQNLPIHKSQNKAIIIEGTANVIIADISSPIALLLQKQIENTTISSASELATSLLSDKSLITSDTIAAKI